MACFSEIRLDVPAHGPVSRGMKRFFLRRFAIALAITTSTAFAYEEPRLDPAVMEIFVGQTAEVGVRVFHLSGLNYTMWRYSFTTDRPDAVHLGGRLEYEHPVWNGTIEVTGLAPGTAALIAGGRLWGTVHVRCGYVEPLQAASPVVIAKKGEPVRLSIIAPSEPGRVLQWYAGRKDDTSHPLAANFTDLEIPSLEPGTHYVWISSTSPCATSSTEFRIDVQVPRRRAAGH